jgi:hypothetical protein
MTIVVGIIDFAAHVTAIVVGITRFAALVMGALLEITPFADLSIAAVLGSTAEWKSPGKEGSTVTVTAAAGRTNIRETPAGAVASRDL